MRTPFGQEHPEIVGEHVQVPGELPAVGEPTMQQDERLPGAALVVPHTYPIDLHIPGHRRSRLCRFSGCHGEGVVVESGHEVEASTQGLDVAGDRFNGGDLAAFDL